MRSSHTISVSLLIALSLGYLVACSGSDGEDTTRGNGGTSGGAGRAGTPSSTGTAGAAAGGRTGSGGSGTSGSAGTPAGGRTGTGGSGGTAGTGGGGGTAGTATAGTGGGGESPAGCLPAFKTVCGPDINFDNQDPGNSDNFDAVIPDVVADMKWAACTVCSILYRTPEELPRKHDTINFIIDNHNGVANAGGNTIRLSTRHIRNYEDPKDALIEFRGVMVHETTHLYQTNGGSSDGALIEGVADFVRVRAGLYEKGRCGNGSNWAGAYTESGCFFSWLAGPCDYHEQSHPSPDRDIGYRINLVINKGKSAVQKEIETTFGATVGSLFNDYKDDY